jgi:hypothetical protein
MIACISGVNCTSSSTFAADIEGAELLRKIVERCRLDIPETERGISFGVGLRGNGVHVPMSGDPLDAAA